MSQRQATSWERSLVSAAWKRAGRPPATLRLWDGTECGADAATAEVSIRFHDPGILRYLWWNPSLALGEGYTEGRITVDGDLTNALVILTRALGEQERRYPWHPRLSERFFRRKGQSPWDSPTNVAHHYDIGNDFYRLWLDRQLVYTCAYYERPDLTLEEAQTAKFDHICRKLRLRPGETVVEAGCGWGAFALHMARQYGVRVRACNLSKEQLAYARNQGPCRGFGRPGRIPGSRLPRTERTV